MNGAVGTGPDEAGVVIGTPADCPATSVLKVTDDGNGGDWLCCGCQ